MADVIVPELGEGIEEATVSYWIKREGDTVSQGEEVVELETQKAVVKIESPTSGTIKEILAEEGDTVSVGAKIAVIE